MYISLSFIKWVKQKKDNLLFYICIKKVVLSQKGSVCFHRLPRSVQLDYIKTRFIYLNFMNY